MSGGIPDAAVTPVSVIVCDDIRQEISGKKILIGVYSEDVIVQSLPTTLTLCFWIQVFRKNSYAGNAKIRVTDPSGNISGEMSLNFMSIENDQFEGMMGAIATPALSINILQTGKISICWSDNGVDFSLIGEKRVMTGPVATAPTAHP